VADLGGRQAVEWVRTRNPWAAAKPWVRTHPWRMYALGTGARWLQPPNRFVIVTAGRTGSELLTDLLGSHPDVICEPEILRERLVAPEQFVAGRAAKAGLGGAQAYGFKIHCGHFGYQVLRERDQYLRHLSDEGVHLIFLRRGNFVAQAVSSTIASRTRWHWRRRDGPVFTPVELDPVEVLMMTYLFEESDHYLEAMLAGLPHLTLRYEDNLCDGPAQQATVDRICDRLGLRHATTVSDHVRFTPPTLSATVANFEAVTALVRGSRFARFLDDESQAGAGAAAAVPEPAAAVPEPAAPGPAAAMAPETAAAAPEPVPLLAPTTLSEPAMATEPAVATEPVAADEAVAAPEPAAPAPPSAPGSGLTNGNTAPPAVPVSPPVAANGDQEAHPVVPTEPGHDPHGTSAGVPM